MSLTRPMMVRKNALLTKASPTDALDPRHYVRHAPHRAAFGKKMTTYHGTEAYRGRLVPEALSVHHPGRLSSWGARAFLVCLRCARPVSRPMSSRSCSSTFSVCS